MPNRDAETSIRPWGSLVRCRRRGNRFAQSRTAPCAAAARVAPAVESAVEVTERAAAGVAASGCMSLGRDGRGAYQAGSSACRARMVASVRPKRAPACRLAWVWALRGPHPDTQGQRGYSAATSESAKSAPPRALTGALWTRCEGRRVCPLSLLAPSMREGAKRKVQSMLAADGRDRLRRSPRSDKSIRPS